MHGTYRTLPMQNLAWKGEYDFKDCYNSILIENVIILYMDFGKELGGEKEMILPCCLIKSSIKLNHFFM